MSTDALHCLHCGYNLTGLPENRCPECGNAFDPVDVSVRSYFNKSPWSRDRLKNVFRSPRVLAMTGILVILAASLRSGESLCWSVHLGVAVVVGFYGMMRCWDEARLWSLEDRIVHPRGSTTRRFLRRMELTGAYGMLFGLNWILYAGLPLLIWCLIPTISK